MAGSLRFRRIKDHPDICKQAALEYQNGATTESVACSLGIAISTARTAILSTGVKLRPMAEAQKRNARAVSERFRGVKRGPMSCATKQKIRDAIASRSELFAGVSLKPNGYMEITRGDSKFKSLHRHIMEKHLGRSLSRGECVHHIDGDKLNNRIENLSVMSRSEHASLHAKENTNKRKRDKNGRLA